MTERTEDWTKDDEGMTTTVVVVVREGGKVWVSEEVVKEFGLDPGLGRDVADGLRERFVLEYDYQAIADALEHKGWEKGSVHADS